MRTRRVAISLAVHPYPYPERSVAQCLPSNRTLAEYLPGPSPRSHPNCPPYLIQVMRLHLQANDHDVMDPALAVYPIRIRDHLGAAVRRSARWIMRS